MVFGRSWRRWAHALVVPVSILMLIAGCGAPATDRRGDTATVPASAPLGNLGADTEESIVPLALEPLPNVPDTKMLARPALTRNDRYATVLLYTSQASQRHLMQKGLDPATGTRMWENLLRSQSIRFQRASSASDLEQADRARLLILPQTTRLSRDERLAIEHWRERGGSILSTWESGTFDENGKPTGFEFMDRVLGVRVERTPALSPDQRFLYPHADGPVLWSLPAGTRIISEHVAALPTLRLTSGVSAASMSDWGRTHSTLAPAASVIVFNERSAADRKSSRLVALGYAEQTWQRMDTGEFTAVHMDIVRWLLRQPQMHTAAWPHPYRSASALAFFADRTGASPADLQQWAALQQIPYSVLLPGLPDAPPGTQTADWSAARAGGIVLGTMAVPGTGNEPPALVHAQRKTALAATQVRAWVPIHGAASSTLDHALMSIDADEGRHPFFMRSDAATSAPAVGLPMTLQALDDAAARQPDLAQWLAEWDIAQRSSALSVVRIAMPLGLPVAQRDVFSKALKASSERQWIATSTQIAHWWRQRDKVQRIAFDADENDRTQLVIRCREPLAEGTVLPIIVSMPSPLARLVLNPLRNPTGASVSRIDAWRSVVLIPRLPAGITRLHLEIDDPNPQ